MSTSVATRVSVYDEEMNNQHEDDIDATSAASCLTLKRQNAVHFKRVQRRATFSKANTASLYVAGYHLIKQFKRFPLATYSKQIVSGFCGTSTTISISVADNNPNGRVMVHIPIEIEALCRTYLVCAEDEILQIAHKLYVLFKAANKTAVPRTVFAMLIGKYLRLDIQEQSHRIRIKFYCQELERLQYIESIAGNHEAVRLTTVTKMCCAGL